MTQRKGASSQCKSPLVLQARPREVRSTVRMVAVVGGAAVTSMLLPAMVPAVTAMVPAMTAMVPAVLLPAVMPAVTAMMTMRARLNGRNRSNHGSLAKRTIQKSPSLKANDARAKLSIRANLASRKHPLLLRFRFIRA